MKGKLAALCFLGLLLTAGASGGPRRTPGQLAALALPLTAGFCWGVYRTKKSRSRWSEHQERQAELRIEPPFFCLHHNRFGG